MNWFIDTATIIGLFVFRLGVPLLITLAVGYLLRRLDARWEAEAEQWREKAAEVERQPVVEKRSPLLRLPFPQPIPLSTAADIFGQPCWELKDCDPALLSGCPAHQHPDEPCWLARWEAKGDIPAVCYNCHIFTATQLNVDTKATDKRDNGIPA